MGENPDSNHARKRIRYVVSHLLCRELLYIKELCTLIFCVLKEKVCYGLVSDLTFPGIEAV